MNQDDFRRLLAAGGDGGGARAFGGKRQLTDADLAEVRRLSKKPKQKGRKPASRPRQQAADGDGTDEPQAPQYRDRAAERRQGGAAGGELVDADQLARLDAEQSKFLGGDVEHTHLVKGLDYALLAQLKREKHKLQQAAEDAKQRTSGEPAAPGAPPKSSKLTFTTRMGRLVFFHSCQSGPSGLLGKTLAKSELFLPGRMDYTFNLSEHEMESIPVAVQRSKDDCPEPDDVAHGIVDEDIISRIGELLSHQQPGKKLRRKKRDHSNHARHRGDGGEEDAELDNEDASNVGETRAPAKDTAVEVDDDDENIFSDVDDYVPVDQRTVEKESRAEERAAIKSKGYFTNLSASINASERAEREKDEEAANAWKATLQKAIAAQARKEQEEVQLAKAKRLAAMASGKDEYSEYQAEGAFVDSDDEGGDDNGGGGDGKKKKKSSGEDVSETELARRKQQKQSNKLQNDLEKISKVSLLLLTFEACVEADLRGFSRLWTQNVNKLFGLAGIGLSWNAVLEVFPLLCAASTGCQGLGGGIQSASLAPCGSRGGVLPADACNLPFRLSGECAWSSYLTPVFRR